MRFLLVICLGIVTACHCPASDALTARGRAPDTVRGLVVVAGANPGVVLIRGSGSAELILLQGPADAPLHALESLEISAAGTIRKGPQGRTLTQVRDFSVLSDSGRPAHDGRLLERGGLFEIVNAEGVATEVPRPSPDLQRHVGERVWLADTAFGVIPELPPESGPVANACSPSRIQRGGRG